MGYPRMLFPGGLEGAFRIVNSDDEEERARAEGFRQFGDVADAADPAADLTTREALWAELESRGVTFDRRWGVSRLQDLLG